MSKSAKKPAKKKAATKKKAVAKKSAKKTVKKAAKKSAPKKVVAKKAAPKKKVVKKAVKKSRKLSGAKKAVVKKVAVKKTVVAKPVVAKPAVVKAPVAKPTAKAQVVKKITEKHSELPGGIIVKAPRAETISTNPNPRPALLNAIIEGLEERKAHNIVVLDLHKINNRSFDYFVIADADSSTHVDAIASSVEEEVKKKLGERPYHTEGWQNSEWILLDYVNIVVHVFQKTIRDFYNIEDLWADAEMQKIN
jgi:ribosome-associated protein